MTNTEVWAMSVVRLALVPWRSSPAWTQRVASAADGFESSGIEKNGKCTGRKNKGSRHKASVLLPADASWTQSDHVALAGRKGSKASRALKPTAYSLEPCAFYQVSFSANWNWRGS